jgi:hypothetical protein
MVGERAEFFERQGIKPFGVSRVNALAVPNFLEQLVEPSLRRRSFGCAGE